MKTFKELQKELEEHPNLRTRIVKAINPMDRLRDKMDDLKKLPGKAKDAAIDKLKDTMDKVNPMSPINKKVTIAEMMNALAAPVALADTASITATAATNAGRTNVFPDTSQNTTVTLPTPSAGLSFRFIYGGAAADAESHIIKTTGNTLFFKGALVHHDTNQTGQTLSLIHI